MTDEDLIKRLRAVTIKQHAYGAYTRVPDPLSSAAADRIEVLEEALRKVGKTYPADNMRLIHGELQILNIVNAALK
jgi:hypothetical protein